VQLECVVNISEGRRSPVIAEIAAAAGTACLDVHSDPHHNRSVLTLAGDAIEVEAATRRVAEATVASLDITAHEGVHPRIGALDVVPFVPWTGASIDNAIAARDNFARWAAHELGLPCFLYGRERSLPDIRREAFGELAPDYGPLIPHPTAGGCAVGERGVLVAYNVWLETGDVAVARAIATRLRAPQRLRALGLLVGDQAQVSCNLIDPLSFGPADAFDAVAAQAAVARAEVVGLLPAAVLAAVPTERWTQLGLAPSLTLEARLGEVQAGPDQHQGRGG
jgi:glutamate formiminotransferase / 5-formyltetrahydrofolate cyclo-ligase